MCLALHGNVFNVLLLGLSLIFLSCKRGPETQDPFSLEVRTDIVDKFEDIRWAEHLVVVREVVPSPKYVYVKVEEGSDTYWIATGPGTIKPGEQYVFNEAVVKTNFRSAALDREFDSIHLVTQFLPLARKKDLKRMRFNPHAGASADKPVDLPDHAEEAQVQKVALNALLEEPSRYEGQQIEVSGLCTKVNANIMDRNWIHISSQAGEGPEVVATSNQAPAVGEPVTLQAIVRLNKDFGAGYVYPILLEEAVIIE